MSYDPEDEQPEPQHGRTFRLDGTPLAAYSFQHRGAMGRLGSLSYDEYCIFLLRLLQMEEQDIDAIRTPQEISNFRIAASKWADGALRGVKAIEAAQRLVEEIVMAVEEAETIQPVPAKKKESPGSRRSRRGTKADT